ncbi:MAG: arginine deiminase-related protein [Gammaproteobacteria bacterium]|nr:arginine deiminase-related protein [Gammaproteobacteria bacterium]
MPRAVEQQAAKAVLMVRPAAFASNPETLASNAFQSAAVATEEMAARAQTEFDAVVAALTAAGVHVCTFDGRLEGDCPDEVFPNNWVSFHADGTVVLYPMLAPSRRRERRRQIIDALEREHGYVIARTVDLTAHEAHALFLEGTGSLVLDRISHVAYACRSPRTHEQVLNDFADRLGYTPVAFDALDDSGRPIYHTNVVMAVGTSFAVVCLEAIADPTDREAITHRLEDSGREIVAVELDQMHDFAANLLELEGRDGRVMTLSACALSALDDSQIYRLERHGKLLSVPIPTIETFGGGSLRCMLAEIHLHR